ncbi:MAG: HPr kinase/phosphatase C-terminal domain-containing protein [Gammaproteobacteria bacterium]|nr:HPr kinase/phosphatase C-terminal domain-containing protein [Gammaproteobacteria bacterium]MBU1656145.1 HPr kinase/phosphatase C-terminal domain-containing protein [Gammaproteobacteria bacterium]MBU1960789.1 HPr kinase/phosphatase C-terminal domain-containing protein [Gammaproteobacteria bacterium]
MKAFCRPCSHRTTDPLTGAQGTLVAIDGRGLLITGVPGAGKSELALGLLDRGHRLVADDAPLLELRNGRPIGRPPSGYEGHLHIQGIGLLDVRLVYGIGATASEIGLDLILHLDLEAAPLAGEELLTGRWDQSIIAGIALPRLSLPSPRGRNLPLLAEILVRHHFHSL